MTAYFDALCEAMTLCAEHPCSTFMGQAVVADGTAMSRTFRHLPREKLLELPVAEDLQLGMATGIALAGGLPICCYPRMNFLLLAVNQLVNHLDKLPLYSPWRPRVLVRVAVPTRRPMDPGPQHLGNFTDAFTDMLKTVHVRRLDTPAEVRFCYAEALEFNGSTLLVEYSELY